jgi:hypothetical protein
MVNTILLKVFAAGILLFEVHIPEIRFANLTDWGWVVFFGIVILVVWLLIIFQINLQGSHPYGDVSDPDTTQEYEGH